MTGDQALAHVFGTEKFERRKVDLFHPGLVHAGFEQLAQHDRIGKEEKIWKKLYMESNCECFTGGILDEYFR